MAIKKSELYSAIWKSCDELRGGMDASEYKNYVLTLLFIKYVTDKFRDDPYPEIEIPKGGSFDDIIACKNKPNIGEEMNKIIAKLAEVNQLSGIINSADFDDEKKIGKGKEKVEKLTNLITIFETSFNFSKNKASGDDIIGDAYEYLMKNFATESGKSKGQFYTPAEVSRIMAKIIGAGDALEASKTVYDPACGSGSLLIRASNEAPNGLTIYGQEYDNVTAGLAKMNLVLHNKASGEIKGGSSTFSNPEFKDYYNSNLVRKFDFVVANPPFSYKTWRNGLTVENDPRFNIEVWGDLPPKKNGDYAWLIHCINSLKSEGKGAVILPHGVLFRGNAEATIREKILKKRIIKGIIGLPANLFYGTGIPACIIIIDKENTASRNGIYMIDASKGFVKDGNKNRLRERDIKKIVDYFMSFDESDPTFGRFVTFKEIENNEWNLNIPRYISNDETDHHNITAHLKGGIPQHDIDLMNNYWHIFHGLKEELFKEYTPGFVELNVPQDEIISTINKNKAYVDFKEKVKKSFDEWKNSNYTALSNIRQNETKPKEFIDLIGQNLLDTFSNIHLIDKFDVYQCVMEFWDEKMQDDVYAIVQDGYLAGREIEKEMTKPKKGVPKMKSFDGKLIPKKLIANTFFKPYVTDIEETESKIHSIQQIIDEIIDNNTQEDGLLNEIWNEDKQEIKKSDLESRIKVIKSLKKNKEEFDKEEFDLLLEYQDHLDKIKSLEKHIKDKTTELDSKIIQKYTVLSENEIKKLLIDDNWITEIFNKIVKVYENTCNKLSGWIKLLVERYELSLPQMTNEINMIQNELSLLVSELIVTEIGDEYDADGLKELEELLKNG